MRILIVGSGGREHAVTRALTNSSYEPELFIAPGNPGTADHGTNVDIESGNFEALASFAHEKSIDLTIVGPEKPLVGGIVDRFEENDLPIVGPSAAAAQLEGSKAFAKKFMKRNGIPTAHHRTFTAAEYESASRFIERLGAPVVVKASGLAAGKGALVCDTLEEAHEALDRIVKERAFGAAGDRIVIEEFMEGEEASVFALTDGEHYVVLEPSQDHKRIGEGGTGPNTGGMGAYAPAPVITDSMMARVQQEIIEPTLVGMREAGSPYRGILYCGLMITDEGPKVVEYNCRLGDPEAQVVLPLMATDVLDVMQHAADRQLQEIRVRNSGGAAACVVLASDGYPVDYDTGYPIEGVSEADAMESVAVLHAGTRRTEDGTLVTDGGRVLNVVAVGPDLETALDRAYAGADVIQFEGKTLRRDIGQKGLAHQAH